MTASEVSVATGGGRAEVWPGLVLTLIGSGLPNLGTETTNLREQAQIEVPTTSGLSWVYAEEQAVVVLTETVRVLRSAAQDGWTCAAVLATGRVGQLHIGGQPSRVIGAALDRARLMAGTLRARPGVLLADEDAARLCGLQTSAAPLLGPRLSLDLPGGASVACAEVLWDRLRPGDLTPGEETLPQRAANASVAGQGRVVQSRPGLATAAPGGDARPKSRPARSAAPAVTAAQTTRADTPLSRWVRGTVLRTGRTFGFLEDMDGQIYYFQPRNMAVDAPLRRGARVVFRVLPAMRGASELRAEDVFVIDAVASGVLERVHPKGWGLVRLDCHNGLEHRLFVQNSAGPGWRVGRTVSCRIGANRQGPVGVPLIEGHSEAAAD